MVSFPPIFYMGGDLKECKGKILCIGKIVDKKTPF